MTAERPDTGTREAAPRTEAQEAAEAVIALVPIATGEPPTQWQRNVRDRALTAIERLRAALAPSTSPDGLREAHDRLRRELVRLTEVDQRRQVGDCMIGINAALRDAEAAMETHHD